VYWLSLQRKALTVGKVRIMTLNYEWQRFYKAAVGESQPGKMQEAVSKAEHAIQQRLADCPPPIMEAVEKRAIGDTLAALAVLKTQIV
jgi:hypothetical protein